MEINGLPLHPLVVHAAVVFGPLAVLSALAYVAVPRLHDRLRWPTLVLVLIGLVSIWAAYLTGDNFFESDRFANVSGEALERIEHHEDLAGTLRWVTTGFAVVAVVALWQHQRRGAVRYALGALVAALAIATLVYTVLTGDAGSKAVWG